VANTFTQLGNLSLARSYILAAAVDGQIYAFGGDTFDGTYLYASDSATVQQIDPATGSATGVTIPSPINPARALAYDAATDHFWAANWDSIIYEFDRTGAIINAFPPVGLSTYGMAWDSWSAGGPFLWLWSQDGPDPLLMASQVNPTTGALTGVLFLGVGVAGEMAGGAAITDQLVPGMAVFLVSIEADFAEQYERFYRAIREGDTLMHIEYRRDRMVYAARQGIYEIFKVQGVTVALCLLWGRDLLHAIGISPLYIHLFYIDVVAVSVQVLLMAILNVLFYLDARREVLLITACFFITNLLFTFATLQLGAETFGYGFAASVSLSAFLGLFILSRKFNRLEYETFMLQG